jgi:hypothetical protein
MNMQEAAAPVGCVAAPRVVELRCHVRGSILAGYTLGSIGVNWQTMGLGDFADNPNEADMLMRDSNTGNMDYFDIQHNQIVNGGVLGSIGLNWQVPSAISAAIPVRAT